MNFGNLGTDSDFKTINILFWNIDKNTGIAKLLGDYCRSYDVDILVLIEDKLDKSSLLEELNSSHKSYHFCKSNVRGISIYTSFDSRLFDFENSVTESVFINFVEFKFPRKTMLLGGIHLSSKDTVATIDGRASLARKIMKEVEKVEKKAKHTNTVIVGDFNMNPFELGMYDHDAFNAVMSRDIAINTFRKIQGLGKNGHDAYHYFYNPMWSFMGDLSKYSPGTYYWYPNSIENNFRWNTFDQVLLRPCLVPNFVEESLKIIETDLLGRKLINSSTKTRSTKQIFDHLPVFLTIDLTK